MISGNLLVQRCWISQFLLYMTGLIKMGKKVRLAQVWEEEGHSCSSSNLIWGLLSSVQTLSSSLLPPKLLWITKHLLTAQETTLIFRLVTIWIYSEVLTFVDQFMALCFMATGAPLAEGRIWTLLINQYAWWSFMHGNLWFVSSGWQLSAPLAFVLSYK
jgi:hypothetical protein